MKFSLNWLSEYVSLPKTTTDIESTLTMAGLEVADISKVAPDFSNVSVAKIISAERHPNADKLQICQVETKNQTMLTIVCGAPNARAGLKVALAEIGAELPGGFQIKRSKIRGQESEGMLCSAKELGLTDESQGILELPDDAPIGISFREYLNLDEEIAEIEFTPNRGDCLSIHGLAREFAALTQQTYVEKIVPQVAPTTDEKITLSIHEKNACPSYFCRIIRDVNPNAKLLPYITQRLERMGVRSVNAIVDIVNYVMLESGQPLHAFDKDKISDEITVRFAKPKEKIVLLNQQPVELLEDTLIIASGEKPIAIAGIMGSLDSAVDNQTKHILLESALFNPDTIAGKARKYGLHTDASFRFERGVDNPLQLKALERATALILEFASGNAAPIVSQRSEGLLPEKKCISLSAERVNNYLGLTLSVEEMASLLERLNMKVHINEQTLEVLAPSYRYDVNIKEDLIEEIARLYGYNNILAKKPVLDFLPQLNSAQQLSIDTIKNRLISLGYHEAINYSFISQAMQALTQEKTNLSLLNPISNDLSTMRSSLLPSLLNNVQYNQNRQQDRVRLFEISRIYLENKDKIEQPYQIAGVISGFKLPEQWGATKTPVDFYDIKGDVLALLHLVDKENAFQIEEAEHAFMQPGQTAKILFQHQVIGHIGAVHPHISKHFDLTQPTFCFEIAYQPLQKAHLPTYETFSKFPSIRRDLAFFISTSISFDTLKQTIQEIVGALLKDIVLFDVYQGKNMPTGTHSIAIGITLQDKEKTLVDEDIQAITQKVIDTFSTRFGAKLRD